jgi:hypothetical protein
MNLFYLISSVAGVRVFNQLAATREYWFSSYTCPSVSRPFRADSQVEFFTTGRQLGDSSWPVVSVEVPSTYQEFMCGIVNRNLSAGCTKGCGYLFKWQYPSIRTFNFTSVLYDTDVYFLDKFKSVLSINPKAASDPVLSTSSGDMVYTVIVPKGTLSSIGISTTDPARISPLPLMTYQGGTLMLPNGLPGIHN